VAFNPSERLGLFVDGPNFALSCRGIKFNPDFDKVLSVFRARSKSLAAVYATATGIPGVAGLVSFLARSGWSMVTKPAKLLFGELKGNMDLELALEMIKRAPDLDHIVLFSGDGDFTCVVKHLQEQGLKVTVISTIDNSAVELRAQADTYIDVESITHHIERLAA
jgi:uncharacterized LabA/DUF88 family protein